MKNVKKPAPKPKNAGEAITASIIRVKENIEKAKKKK